MTTKAKKKTFPAMYCETVADTIKALFARGGTITEEAVRAWLAARSTK